MGEGSHSGLEVEVLTVVRELHNGDWTAFPVADPSRVSYGTEAGCLEEQRLFLGEYLADLPATEWGRFSLPEDVALETAEVVVARDELPKRLRSLPPIAISCLVIPAGRAAWVLVLPLRHTFYAEDASDWRETARGEINRVAAARELSATEYLELLPPASQRLERLRVEVTDAAGKAGPGRRKARDDQRKRRDARRLLEEIGTPLAPPSKQRKRRPGSGPTPRAGRVPGKLVGRDRDFATLESLLGGQRRLSVVVIGRELVGKSALIEAALDRREHVYVTSGARLLAGQSFFGQWQERAHKVMKAAELLDAVLYFDNLADLFSARDSSEDIAGLMRPYLERRRLRVVAELTPSVADRAALAHVGFFSQLHPVKLEPLDAATTRRVLEARARRHCKAPGPQLRGDAITALVDLAERYLPYRAFPGKAVRLYDELRVTHAGDVDAAGEPLAIGAREVHEALSRSTGIPAFMLRDDRPLKLEEIVQAFRRSIIGQAEATGRVAETLCAVKARLKPASRPLATFLFVGPTGVGKTELARTLARFLFGSAQRLLRFDMSEYMDPWAAERLIRGTDCEQGLLTRKVRQQPFSVLLLDEIEKADGAVFDLLLQVMGEARLTDAAGRTAHFHNTILIMTSNLGAAHRRQRPGFASGDGRTSSQQYYEERVEEHFRPEFVNRLDKVVAFEALSAAEVRAIAGLAVRGLGERHGLSDRGIELDVAGEVLDALALEAYDPAYGARRLHRHLERSLVAPVAGLLARLGSAAENSVIEVRPRSGDGQGAGAGAIEETESLRIVCRRRAGKPRAETRAFDRISGLRRRLRVRLRGRRLRELEERIEALATQLAYGGGRKQGRRPSQAIVELHKEHHRLSQIWERLISARREVEDVEELAIHATFDGEPIAPLLESARAADGRWRAVLPHALVALEPERDQITLMATECDGWRGLDLWLAPLVAEAPRRGWSLTGHLFRDPDDAGSATRWGPRRGAAELGEMVTDADREWRRVLLRLAGPDAGIFMATEGGIHRFLHAERSDGETFHLEVERVAWRSEWTKSQLEAVARLLGRMLDPAHIGSSPAVRGYNFKSRTLTLAGAAGRLALPYDDYWPRFDEIVCEHLLIYEDEPGRDRDRELLAVRLTEKEIAKDWS